MTNFEIGLIAAAVVFVIYLAYLETQQAAAPNQAIIRLPVCTSTCVREVQNETFPMEIIPAYSGTIDGKASVVVPALTYARFVATGNNNWKST